METNLVSALAGGRRETVVSYKSPTQLTIVQFVDAGWRPSLLFSLHTERPASWRSTPR